MKFQTGLLKIAAAIIVFGLLITGSPSSSTQRADALQATQAATLTTSMSQSLVPCATGVKGPCDMIATKPEDIVGIWKQYLGGPAFNAPGGMAYIRYNADGTYNVADTVENTAKPFKIYPSGTYKFDGDQLVIAAIPAVPPPCNGAGVFQVRVLKYGDKLVALRYVPISDTCTDRLQDLSQALVWVASGQ